MSSRDVKGMEKNEATVNFSITHENVGKMEETKSNKRCHEEKGEETEQTDPKKPRETTAEGPTEDAGERRNEIIPQQRRPHGLYNQGATCYLNSILQVLSVTEICKRLDSTSQELTKIFEDMKRKSCRTESITQCLGIENVHQQRDAAECLYLILHKINSEASELFEGQMRHSTKCFDSHIINEETNPFWTLPLPLTDTINSTCSVESSFKRIFEEKTFSKQNMVYCPECNEKTKATSICEMVECPQILILHLKRFAFDCYTKSYVKSHRSVEVQPEFKFKDKEYNLYGMVNHIGSRSGGHYTATILSDEDKSWYDCNDRSVTKVNDQLFKSGLYTSKTVYLLMYKATRCQKPVGTTAEDLTVEMTKEQDGDTDPCDSYYCFCSCCLWPYCSLFCLLYVFL